MKDIFLIDFDGTIALNDSTHVLAHEFIPEKLEIYRQRFRENKVNVKAFVYDLLTSLEIDKEVFRETLHKHILIDESFKEFVKQNIEIRIVSAGTKLNVKYSLESIGLDFEESKIYANDIVFNGKNIEIFYPHLDNERENGIDKVYIVDKYKKLGYRVIFVGDGPSDYMAAKVADIVFARKSTRLVAKCKEYNVDFWEFSDFKELYEKYRYYYLSK